jgi:hypothetical protein
MLKSGRLELRILRYAQTVDDSRGMPTSWGALWEALQTAVDNACRLTDGELLDALKLLHKEGRLRLRKWDETRRGFVEYEEGRTVEGEFFYRGEFWLLITPEGRRYCEELQAEEESEPEPKRPIGFR